MKRITVLIMILCLSMVGISGCVKKDETSTSSVSEEIVEVDAAGEANVEGEGNVNEEVDADSSSRVFGFSTEDIDGNAVEFSDYSNGKKVIMINYWEPWCGPCIGEMPDLEKLYQNYKDEGFLIVGVYTTSNDDGSVTEAIENTGITYPCIVASENLYDYMTGYVPTTFFVDGDGNLLSSEPIVGSNTYEDWEITIKEYM